MCSYIPPFAVHEQPEGRLTALVQYMGEVFHLARVHSVERFLADLEYQYWRIKLRYTTSTDYLSMGN